METNTDLLQISPAKQTKSKTEFIVRCVNIRGLSANSDIDFNIKFRAVTCAHADMYVFLEHRTKINSFLSLEKRQRLTLGRYRSFFSTKTGRGIWILIQKNSKLSLSSCEELTPDVFRVTFSDDQQSLGFLIIYGPSDTDDPAFFCKLWEYYRDMDTQCKAIIGDFNCTLDKNLDRENYATDMHKKSRLIINSWIESNEVSDAFRAYYPYQKSFTFTGNKGQKGRLDLCLANYNCLSKITTIRHIPIGMIDSRGQKTARLISDHLLVHVNISLNEIDKGPGSFRANPLIETNSEYASLVRINITALLAEISGVSSTEKMQAKFNTLRRESFESVSSRRF